MTTQQASVQLKPGATEIRRALDVLFDPGDVVEIRAFKNRNCTISGYYDNFQKLTADAATINSQGIAVYVTLNRIDPDLLSRRANRYEQFATTTTNDDQVVRRRWFPVDLDPVRPSGISSSGEEHDAAIEKAREVHRYLAGELGWPEPIAADSGNGGHLLFRIDLPNNAKATQQVKNALQSLHAKFSDKAVVVDAGNYNASRIWKLYGTVACKGDNTESRPHRQSKLLYVSDSIETAQGKLQTLADMVPKPEGIEKRKVRGPQRINSDNGKLNVAAWLREHNVGVLHDGAYSCEAGSGHRWVLDRCVWNPEHNDKSAFVIQFDSGGISAGCWHNSCTGKTWHDLRDAVEPGWRQSSAAYTKTAQTISVDETCISNVRIEQSEKAEHLVPVPMSAVIDDILQQSGRWPRRVGNALFVDDGKQGVCWIDRPAALFGWLARQHGTIDWRRSVGCVSKEETFSELQRTVRKYVGIETLPHEPRIADHYYVCEFPDAGDGVALDKLLDFFSLETPLDRQLLMAVFATPIWGGPAGTRPAAMFTATTGRGKGKTRLATFWGKLFGGFIDVDPSSDMGIVKQRLLSPEAIPLRIGLLDNVKRTRFSWGELEALLTTDVISGKRLYVGEASRPNFLTWAITLNGASLSTDMAQRVIEIRLRDPDYRTGWDEEVGRFIDENRPALIGDLIGFLRRPAKVLAKLSRWATWDAQVLARVEDPGECLDLILDRRGQVDVEDEVGRIVEDYFRGRLAGLGYEPDRVDVFIPNQIARQWYNAATGEKCRTTAVTRSLKQMYDEGKMSQIVQYREGVGGQRGFRWVGERVDVADSLDYGLVKRLAKQKEEKESGEF